jgi:hypothetical protein
MKNPRFRKDDVIAAPIGKDGKDQYWFNRRLKDGLRGATWAGVIKYCKSLKLDPYIVGWHIEKQFGDKTTTAHLNFAARVHYSLMKVKEKYFKVKRSRTPMLETDLHYAIRMDLEVIKKLYYEASPRQTTDFYKSARQLYNDIMKKRKSYVLAMFEKPK